ncbi:Holliday junction resolvase RuvX [Oscillatoria sp. CS-180]|uniref:Holliday junction resolvase RuvX n=1 Tax=Oscillatoria sp. CS-180 TaxID=3021720 RepID=UPI0023305289|nr:Holliday junction resolvase RuvX [Oscillatoria sp. CS-180]MDB9528473.1 Holliday junction resolvase RuvX [Oscillatoria sp. CS-180]
MVSTADTCSQPVILGFDPGRQKCGIAVMGLDRTLFHRSVVASEAVLSTVEQLQKQLPISLIVMGDQTSASEWKEMLAQLSSPLRVVLVDERYSSLEARDRYWQLHPPKGLQRLLPQGLRQPSVPIDDIVAMLLIERYLNRLIQN